MVTGRCLCGGVRYEISEPFEAAGYCHCTRCQRRTGSAASASGRIVPGSLRVVAGEELIRCWDPGDGGWPKCFCSTCGSALWSRHPEEPDRLSVRLGTVDGDPGVRPAWHQFVAYAAVWEPIPDDGLPRFPESRSA
ncbi:MAG: GFA family protein [Actinobacteria bacterium]|nr:GFA family protein [Actinomycetota bacterium]